MPRITGPTSGTLMAGVGLDGSIYGLLSGRIRGKKSTSGIEVSPVMNIARRSMPIPIPEQVGIPYSRARTKSMSDEHASSSPFSEISSCSWKRSSWSIGSLSLSRRCRALAVDKELLKRP